MPPLGCIQKEGGRWKIEEWLEQILSEQDPTKKEKATETNLTLTTTIRSSSEEREATASGCPSVQEHRWEPCGKGSSEWRPSKKRNTMPGSRDRKSGANGQGREKRQPSVTAKPGAKAGSRALKRDRGHWTFHTASAQANKKIEAERDDPKPLLAPWQVSASRIRLIEEAIHDFGEPRTENSTETAARQHRVVEACGEICWACADYGQNVITPSFIGCCTRPSTLHTQNTSARNALTRSTDNLEEMMTIMTKL